jgi:hypothetical protein
VKVAMNDERRRRSDERWAARYRRSQAAFEAADRLSEGAGGWVESVQGADGVRYRIVVIPPGEPVGSDPLFYVSLVLSWLTRGLVHPTAKNQHWVVEVRRSTKGSSVSRVRFSTYREALDHVRTLRHSLGHVAPPSAP